MDLPDVERRRSEKAALARLVCWMMWLFEVSNKNLSKM